MVSYVCRKCNFKYTPRIHKSKPPLTCHNCGGKGTIDVAPDAEQIIRDSAKF